MTIKIQTTRRETFETLCDLPLSADNLMTAAKAAPDWAVFVSVVWDGGPHDRFTLHSVTDHECRQLATANGPRIAAEIIDRIGKLRPKIAAEIARLAA